MKTLNYILIALIQFFKGSSLTPKTNTENNTTEEITHTKFGSNLKNISEKAPNSLLSLLYSEENEALFI